MTIEFYWKEICLTIVYPWTFPSIWFLVSWITNKSLTFELFENGWLAVLPFVLFCYVWCVYLYLYNIYLLQEKLSYDTKVSWSVKTDARQPFGAGSSKTGSDARNIDVESGNSVENSNNNEKTDDNSKHENQSDDIKTRSISSSNTTSANANSDKVIKSELDVFIVRIFMVVFTAWWFIVALDCISYHWTESMMSYLFVHINNLNFSFNYSHAAGLKLVIDNYEYVFFCLKWFWFFMICLGNVLVCKAKMDCPYATPYVKIDVSKGHKVIDSGIFGYIRHPIYCGGNCAVVGISLFVQSLAAFAVSILIVIINVIRIKFEEDVLKEHLPGYTEYQKKVIYKLVPYVY